MQEPQLKNNPNKKPTVNILDTFVKSKSGTIYQVIPHNTKKGVVLLRNKNKYIEKTLVELKQEIVNRNWFSINEHEYRKWAEEDNKHMMLLSHKLVKRILLTQLLIELDDELESDFNNDKYMRNVIEKSKKQCERLVVAQYNKIYETDKTYVTNFMNSIDDFATTCAQFKIEDFLHINTLIRRYNENPEQYQDKMIAFTKLDS